MDSNETAQQKISLDTNLISRVNSQLSLAQRWDHFLARWGVARSRHKVTPGLYALGNPQPESPVLVTANYTLSFDALRTALPGWDAYLLVLDTQGINVWCAAGKGTFGSDELVRRIEASHLDQVVNHRRLILPQLGAPGVSAQEVKQRSGFSVEYGPVRARDLPEYLQSGKASPAMRRVDFPLRERLVLIPVEFVYVLFPWLLLAVLLQSIPAVAAILAGAVLFPILLPWLPSPNFSTKGWFLGILVSIPWVLTILPGSSQVSGFNLLWMLANLLVMPNITAFLALNFTGSSTYTSRSGVKREMLRYIPVMAWSSGAGLMLMLLLGILKLGGWYG